MQRDAKIVCLLFFQSIYCAYYVVETENVLYQTNYMIIITLLTFINCIVNTLSSCIICIIFR